MLKLLTEKIHHSERIKAAIERVRSGGNFSCDGLIGSSDVVAAFLFIRGLKPVHSVFIAPDVDAYSNILDDMTALSSNAGEACPAIFCYPEEDTLPYDEKEPSVSIASLRQECLEQLLEGKSCVVITTIKALLKKIPLPEKLSSYRIELKKGSTFQFHYLTELLSELGFERNEVVDQVGTFAVRGGIVDMYLYSMENPVRVEFFGDVIESIREFDVMTQRSIGLLDNIVLYPKNDGNHAAQREGNLFDYLDPAAMLFQYEPDIATAAAEKFQSAVKEYYEKKAVKQEKVQLPDEIYFTTSGIREQVNRFKQIHFCRLSKRQFEILSFQTRGVESFNGHLNLLREKISAIHRKHRVFILCGNPGQVERLDDLLDSEQLHSGVDYVIGAGELHEGFYFDDADVAVFTDHQIFGRVKRARVYRRFKSAQALRHIHSLKPGDFVVHVDHGIAKYAGLEKVTSGEHTEECLKLLYQSGDKLFVPLEHFMRVQKFSADEGAEPKLNKLGSVDWDRLKSRTRKSIKDIAQDLIKLYAERKSKKGYAFRPDSDLQYELEASFEYEDTPDQSTVTVEVKKDMEQETPMDRLVCGDVGYGKTEIAIRASFKTIQDSKQVAILVPTTILAEQHFETFSARMKEFPARVDVISRFKSAKEQKQILEKIKTGEIDILIGTHRLLSKDIVFKDLGLLIIDEEQRFGVVHKERLRQMKSTVHTLTLTATPIPRTLHFSLMGGRDLSVINTPPQDRLPIETEITQFDEDLIHDAIMQEIDRGGQVYYVHNRVQSIEQVAETLRQIVPKARLTIVHGQMPPRKVEDVVHAFMQKKYDVLIATTIIENGIDIPNVNTILIDHAHQFGLSQLYQLRGRVGRSNKQAYCYLLTMSYNTMATDALRRLQAIEEFAELGSGFLIAMRDLEIRGAGNLLGSEQSGYMNAVGYELYCQIVEEAVFETKKEIMPDTEPAHTIQVKEKILQTHVDVFCDTYIPDYYVNVQSERVRIYKELSGVQFIQKIEEIQKELVDRFGPVPDEVQNLLKTLEIKFYASRFGFERVAIDENKIILRIDAELVKDKTATGILKQKMNIVLSSSDNIRLFQEKENLDIRIGFPWFDIQKNKSLPWNFPVTDQQKLDMALVIIRGCYDKNFDYEEQRSAKDRQQELVNV
ncbi:transcription-repair coupling factor [bacterium]|nr:transcription-repair coupling factor [bacterium]